MRRFYFQERMKAISYGREVLEPSKKPRAFLNTKLGNPGHVCLLCKIHVKLSWCLNSHKLDVRNVSDMSLNINYSSNAIISCSAIMKANLNRFFSSLQNPRNAGHPGRAPGLLKRLGTCEACS